MQTATTITFLSVTIYGVSTPIRNFRWDYAIPWTFFQEKMNELFSGFFEEVLVYIVDILIVTKGSFADHVEKLERALILLRDAGLKVNVKKSFFAQTMGRGPVLIT